MSDTETGPDVLLGPRVFLEDGSVAAPVEPLTPRVIPMAETGRINPPPPKETKASKAKAGAGYSLIIKMSLACLAVAVVTWLAVDLYLWITAAFAANNSLGWTATAALSFGIAAAAIIIGHELRSYVALKSVETIQARLAVPWTTLRSSDAQEVIRATIREIPKDHESNGAIEVFQARVQRHHTPSQQLDLFSQTVMKALDHRAESAVRRAGARAFAITAISPTAATDAVFFIAVSVRMIREIAACYGHRPSAWTTFYIVRRLISEAAKLSAVDLAGAAITQQLGGAIAERITSSAAESIYAAQRMGWLGLVSMRLCRPIPFPLDELPGVFSTLVGALFAQMRRERFA
jgi:putative membrane protein